MKAKIREAFELQAAGCAALGSDFTARLCRLFAENCKWDCRVGEVVLNWSGDVAYTGDNIPLRIAGALHALVLTGSDGQLTSVYPPLDQRIDDQELWVVLENALERHADFIISRLSFAPQTNEMRRSAPLLAGFLTIAEHTGLPLVLSEIGASSGLNLIWDHYSYTLGSLKWGNNNHGIHLAPQWTGPNPPDADLSVLSRAACDLNPLDITDPDQRVRALSYIWPDQPERVSRTEKAMDVFSDICPEVETCDAVSWLEKRLNQRHDNATHVIFHSIVRQYFTPQDKAASKKLIEQAGERATQSSPIAWLQMEADDQQPGGGLTLTIWPDGTKHHLGRADFHGRWVDWQGIA